MTEAIAVMMNNYFHDLAVAFLFATSWLSWVVLKRWPGTPSPDVVRLLCNVAWGSLAWVLIGGAIRAWFYAEYEWSARAGAAQIPALGVKHVVLFVVTGLGLVGVVRLQRLSRGTAGSEGS